MYGIHEVVGSIPINSTCQFNELPNFQLTQFYFLGDLMCQLGSAIMLNALYVFFAYNGKILTCLFDKILGYVFILGEVVYKLYKQQSEEK